LVAADSLIDPLLLEGLGANDRLKMDEQPVGLAPGEAATVLLLESPSSAKRRGASASSCVHAVSQGLEKQTPSVGRALSKCLADALAARQQSGPFDGEFILDLNGENWRAYEWGCALTRLAKRLGRVDPRLPATSLGDTGAASGALGVGYANHLLWRGVTDRDLLVVSRSEAGEVGCVCVGPAV
jgi:3-oxoacyl-[acyl-carrier-protein] synthase-1